MPLSTTAAANQVAVFSDFDGTLVRLAETPADAVVPAGLTDLLVDVRAALDGAFALVTGRPIRAVDGFFVPEHFAVAGGHGSERRQLDGTEIWPAEDLQIGAAAITKALEPLARAHPRLVLEGKAAAVALHYRQAPELEALCREAVTAAAQRLPLFTVVEGKMVFEIRPAGIDKGTGIRAFMAEAPFSGRVPLFMGDDLSDEDGFAALAAFGGIGIKVGPGPTAAAWRAQDTRAVLDLLRAISKQPGLDREGLLQLLPQVGIGPA